MLLLKGVYMIAVHPEFLINERSRKKSVLIPFPEWTRVMEAMEELEDIRAYDKAKSLKEPAVLFQKVFPRNNVNKKR